MIEIVQVIVYKLPLHDPRHVSWRLQFSVPCLLVHTYWTCDTFYTPQMQQPYPNSRSEPRIP